MKRSKSNPKLIEALPPPTASEAAFERVLRQPFASLRTPAHQDDTGSESVDRFVERVFSQRSKYLQRDDFSGIGERTSFPTKIMGVSFEGRQDVVAGLVPGSELELRRQLDNPFDSNAIACYFGTFHIGFLRKEIAKHLAPLVDGGARYRARIEHVTGGQQGKNYGVNIRVERVLAAFAGRIAIAERATSDRDAIRRALIGDAPLHAAQQHVLDRLEAGKNTFAIMGTGRGKSFCFHYPAAYRALEHGKKTLAIYPLRALANDQFEAVTRRLHDFGLRIFRANGSIGIEERAALMHALANGEWDVVMATPEFLQFHRDAFAGASRPDFVVVDEAHHLYDSKHRAAYAALGASIAALGSPQVLALTATARDEAFDHVVKELKIDAWVIDPTVRENLRVVDARETKDKIAYLRRVFAGGGKAIVYCNSRSEATKIAEGLRKNFGSDVMFYHAGMPTAERLAVEGYFRSGELRIVIATSAFGEGIDLPDVRHVVLYHLNFDFTEFNQQAGRAGRDGASAEIHLLFGESDRRINDFIIDQEAPRIDVLRELYKAIRGLSGDAVVRMGAAEIARTLEFEKVTDRTVAVALRIFEDACLIESGIDDDGRYVRFLPVGAKVDLTKNERFAEGEAERENFARFCAQVLEANAQALEKIMNRPLYPQHVQLLR